MPNTLLKTMAVDLHRDIKTLEKSHTNLDYKTKCYCNTLTRQRHKRTMFLLCVLRETFHYYSGAEGKKTHTHNEKHFHADRYFFGSSSILRE